MKIPSTLKKRGLLWIIPGLLVLGLACFAVAVKIVNSIDYRNNDFFTFWLAGHMVTQGGDPYAPAQWLAGHHAYGVTWIPNQAYVYPLPLSLLFAPLGWLSLRQAFIVWVALSILMILAALMLLLKTQTGSAGYAAIPLLAGMALFRPTILTLFHGQISAWLLLVLAVTAYLWEKGQWEWGSLLLPLLMFETGYGTAVYKEVLRRRGVIECAIIRQTGGRILDRYAMADLTAILDDLAPLMNPAWPAKA